MLAPSENLICIRFRGEEAAAWYATLHAIRGLPYIRQCDLDARRVRFSRPQ